MTEISEEALTDIEYSENLYIHQSLLQRFCEVVSEYVNPTEKRPFKKALRYWCVDDGLIFNDPYHRHGRM